MSAIVDKYHAVQASLPSIGKPVGPEQACPDGVGKFQDYTGAASIYWTPTTGAHLIYDKIRDKWVTLGREKGPNGYPTSDEQDAANGLGRYNTFQHGAIYYRWEKFDAFTVYGAIYACWLANGLDSGALGFPITDEANTLDNAGRFNRFERGMVVYSGTYGTHPVLPPILMAWTNAGREGGSYGYPTGNRVGSDTGATGAWSQAFHGGTILATKMFSYGLKTTATVAVNEEQEGHVTLRDAATKAIVRDFKPLFLNTRTQLRTAVIIFRESYSRRFNPTDILDVQNAYANAWAHIEDASFGMVRSDYTSIVSDTILKKSDFKDDKTDTNPNTFEAGFIGWDKVKASLSAHGFDPATFDIVSVCYPWQNSPTDISTIRVGAWANPNFALGNAKTWATVNFVGPGSYWWAFFVHENFHPIEWMFESAGFADLHNPDGAWWGNTFVGHYNVTTNHPPINEAALGEYGLYPYYAYVWEHWTGLVSKWGRAITEKLGQGGYGDILLPSAPDKAKFLMTSWRIQL